VLPTAAAAEVRASEAKAAGFAWEDAHTTRRVEAWKAAVKVATVQHLQAFEQAVSNAPTA